MREGPKLLNKKPKKSERKPVEFGVSKMASSSSAGTGAAAPPPPPQTPVLPVKESFIRRYRFMIPLLLAVNLSVGAYLFMRTKKKDMGPEESKVPATSTPKATEITAVTAIITPYEIEPRAPVPENQQRELFKWILEERRKVKPQNAEEKKKIDEEKAILKQYIRAKTLPTL